MEVDTFDQVDHTLERKSKALKRAVIEKEALCSRTTLLPAVTFHSVHCYLCIAALVKAPLEKLVH